MDSDPRADRPPSGNEPNAHDARWRGTASAQPSTQAQVSSTRGSTSRFFGGSPPAVLFRLALLSIVVGVIFAVFGFDPRDLARALTDLARTLFENSAELIESLVRYFLLGAAIVFPIWLVVRILKIASRR